METRPYARRNAAGRIQHEPATWNNFTFTSTHSELVDHFLRAGCPPDQARQNTDREFRTPVTSPGIDAPIPAEYSEDGRAQRGNSRGRASSPPRRAQGRGTTPFDLFRRPENFPSQDPDGYVRHAEELDSYRRWFLDLSHQEPPGEPRRGIERLVGVMIVEESARCSRDSLPIDWRNVLFQYLWQCTECTEEEVQKLIDQAVEFQLEARNGRPSQRARPPRGYAPRRYQPPTRAQVQDADSAEVFSAILCLVLSDVDSSSSSGIGDERRESGNRPGRRILCRKGKTSPSPRVQLVQGHSRQ